MGTHRTKSNPGRSGGQGMGYLLQALLGATAGGEEANPNFNTIPIGTDNADVPYDAYKGQNMGSYKGMSPTEISNTPLRPRGEWQTSMGNKSNEINSDYRQKMGLVEGGRTSALALENLRSHNDETQQASKFKHEDEAYAQTVKDKEAAAQLDYLQKWALQNNVDVGDLKRPEVKQLLLDSLQTKQTSAQSKDKLDMVQNKQKTSALEQMPNFAKDEMQLGLDKTRGENAMRLYQTLSPGQSIIRINPNSGLPTSVGASQPYPIEEPIMQNIGGQEFPTGKFNSQQQRPQITIPRNDFLGDEPSAARSLGNPYPPSGLPPYQPSSSNTTSAIPLTQEQQFSEWLNKQIAQPTQDADEALYQELMQKRLMRRMPQMTRSY